MHTLNEKCTDMFWHLFLDMGILLFGYSGKIVEARKKLFNKMVLPILHPILLGMAG